MLSQEEKQSIIGLFPFFSKTPIVFDIGSNKGHFSDIVLEEFGHDAEIHLFEPNQKLLSFTEIKYEYRQNISYNNVAAYSNTIRVPFYYFENKNNELSSLYQDGTWEGLPMLTKNVQGIRIDSYCIDNDIDYVDCIKIDCEGSDVDAMNGCTGLLEKGAVAFLLVEYSPHYKRANARFQTILDIAERTGYKVYYYLADNYWEVTKETFIEDYRFENFIITKEFIRNCSTGGWNNNFILSVADLPKFDLMLEVGTFEGLTAKYMCENMLNEGGRVIVVDPLFDYYVEDDERYHPDFKGQYQRFLRNTRRLPVELKRGKSDDELPKLVELKCDFCFIDGNHYYPAVYNDAINVFKMTKNEGYILFDDYDLWAQETKDGIDKFLNEYAPYIKTINKGYQCLIQKIIDP